MEQKKIYKRNGRYFASDLEVGIIHNFGKCMSEACSIVLSNILNPMPQNEVLHGTIVGRPDPSFVEFSEAISGNAVSKKYCRTKFDVSSTNERHFFEFANRIGAYIIFIFIASIQRSLNEIRTDDKQSKGNNLGRRIKELQSELFRKSIVIDNIFYEFTDLIRSANSHNFEILIEAFRRLYPGIYKGLQNEWRNEVADHSNWLEAREQAGVYCDHKWEQVSIIMLPEKYYFCRKCSDLIDGKHMNRILEQK